MIVVFVFGLAFFNSADLSFLVAFKGSSGLPVIANRSNASWEVSNRISLNEDASRFYFLIKPFSPLFISNSWSSIGDDLDVLENFGLRNIHIT